MPEWEAEREVGAARAAALIAGAAPHLAGADILALATGWDNTVVVVGEEWAFRFPRRAVAVPGVTREIALLPRLAPLLPLPVPVPEVVGADDDPVEPWPFTGARLLPGQELADAGLADEARIPAAEAIGAFLRALHSSEVPAGVRLPVDPVRRGFPAARLAQTRADLDRLAATGIWSGSPAVDGVLARAALLEEPSAAPVLVHGDLHARHLLVDRDGRPPGSSTGVTSAWPTPRSTSPSASPLSPGPLAPPSWPRTGPSTPTASCVPARWRSGWPRCWLTTRQPRTASCCSRNPWPRSAGR